jgi:hypothetical protein
MLSQTYYIVRSKMDGRYLVAHPNQTLAEQPSAGFLLMFQEHFDALSYLNTHGAAVVDRFAVETITGGQIAGLIQRWNFTGVGIVHDPLLPKVEFLSYQGKF